MKKNENWHKCSSGWVEKRPHFRMVEVYGWGGSGEESRDMDAEHEKRLWWLFPPLFCLLFSFLFRSILPLKSLCSTFDRWEIGQLLRLTGTQLNLQSAAGKKTTQWGNLYTPRCDHKLCSCYILMYRLFVWREITPCNFFRATDSVSIILSFFFSIWQCKSAFSSTIIDISLERGTGREKQGE